MKDRPIVVSSAHELVEVVTSFRCVLRVQLHGKGADARLEGERGCCHFERETVRTEQRGRQELEVATSHVDS